LNKSFQPVRLGAYKMKCPKCQTGNRKEAEFCKGCGNKLDVCCPECGNSIQPENRFCDKCGHNLQITPDPLLTEKKEYKEKIVPAPIENSYGLFRTTDGERKYVTVLFSDLSGYTAMSEKLDPEEVKEITSHIFGEIAQIVAKYDGFIEKYVGDAVMAIFGVQRTYEDDPVRAIKASREIHRIVESISPKYEKKIEQKLFMNTGINTGLVITGEIDLEKGTHGVAGDTINVAARLSGLGNKGEILVGADTYSQAEGYFDFEELEPVTVKGKSKPVRVHKVLTAKDHPIKIHRLHGLKADLIGRSVETDLLSEAVRKLKEGKGSIVSICGSAGTGKSRLVRDFKGSLNLEEIQWLEGHAYPYAQNIPYYTLIDLFNRMLQIEEGDSPKGVKKKVESGISTLIGDRDDVLPYIGSLLSLDYPEIESVSPEFWKAQLQKGVQTVFSELPKRAPAIICFEDLHWADPSFLELIRLLLPDMRGSILFICIYRPTISLFTSSQINAMASHYKEIHLQDLSPSESQVMVESLLKTNAMPSELKGFIHDKIEGNPFYIEEVINSLIESETLVRENGDWRITRPISESDISSSIHGVISGRLDRLEKTTKRILQEASVIGRAFLYEILKKITELKNQIDGCLNNLERLDLIKTRTIHPDLEYIFKHALTQEVVYNGLLKKERKEIHKRIGIVIEELFHDRLSEFYESLAFHFRLGESTYKAVGYLIKSGEKSLKRYALEEAHNYYMEAFEILSSKLDKSHEENELLIDLLIKWCYVFYYKGKYNDWIELLLAHEDIAESIKDKEKAGMFFAWLGFVFIGSDNARSKYFLEKALKIGEKTQNEKVIAYAYTWLPFTCSDLGLLDQAIQYGNKARQMENLMRSDTYLFFKSLAGLGIAYWSKGESKKTFEIGRKLVEYGQQYSNIRSQTLGNMALALGYNIVGDFQQQNKYFQKAIEVSADPFYDNIAKTYLGLGYILNNQIVEAEEPLNEAVIFGETNKADWCGDPAKMMQGIVMIAKGNMNKGLKRIKETLDIFISRERKVHAALTEHVLGKIYLQITTGSEPISFLMILKNISFLIQNVPIAAKKAEDHLNNAIQMAKEIGAKSVMAQAYFDLGLLHKAKKKREKARECISNAIRIFEECDAEVFLKQAKEALSSLK